MDIVRNPVAITNSGKYVTPRGWETSFDIEATKQWAASTRNLIIGLAIFYLLVIFSVQRYMKNRPAYKLRNVLVIWNSILAILSITAFFRMLPDFIELLSYGFHQSICKWNPQSVTGFWLCVLALLKIVELGDTIFVVLRKKKLIFLHWYHHFSVLILSWISLELYEASLFWVPIINSFVHGLMYSYYALKVAGVKLPRHYSMVLTSIQIVQLVLGLIANTYAFIEFSTEPNSKCDITKNGILVGFMTTIPYLILFLKFFYDSYFNCSPKHLSNLKNGSRPIDRKKQG